MSKTMKEAGNAMMGCGCAMMLLPIVVVGFVLLGIVLLAMISG